MARRPKSAMKPKKLDQTRTKKQPKSMYRAATMKDIGKLKTEHSKKRGTLLDIVAIRQARATPVESDLPVISNPKLSMVQLSDEENKNESNLSYAERRDRKFSGSYETENVLSVKRDPQPTGNVFFFAC